MKNDPNRARGALAPGPSAHRGAWANIQDIRRAAMPLENKVRILLIDGEEKDHALLMFDAALCYIEAIINRYDRNGGPEGLTELGEMEATLSLARKNPDQFKAFDLEGLKKKAAALRGEAAAKPKK